MVKSMDTSALLDGYDAAPMSVSRSGQRGGVPGVVKGVAGDGGQRRRLASNHDWGGQRRRSFGDNGMLPGIRRWWVGGGGADRKEEGHATEELDLGIRVPSWTPMPVQILLLFIFKLLFKIRVAFVIPVPFCTRVTRLCDLE